MTGERGCLYRLIQYPTTAFESVNVGVWLYGADVNAVAFGNGWDRAAAVAVPGHRTAGEIEALAHEFATTILALPPKDRDVWGEGPYARFQLREPYPCLLSPRSDPEEKAAELARDFVATERPVYVEEPGAPDRYLGRNGYRSLNVSLPDDQFRRCTDLATAHGYWLYEWSARVLGGEAALLEMPPADGHGKDGR